MNHIDNQSFLAWAVERNIGHDPRYPASCSLCYLPNNLYSRFWNLPGSIGKIPFFFDELVMGFERWQYCTIYPRAGMWRENTPRDSGEAVANLLLQAAGIPFGESVAVRYPILEKDKLLAVLLAFTVFGWNSNHDLYVVPDHRRQFLHADHDGAVHVNFVEGSMIGPFVDRLAVNGFVLPKEVPSDVFKRPGWIE